MQIVGSANEKNVLRVVAAAPPVGMEVVELEPFGFAAATTVRVHEAALVFIALTNGAFDRSRDIA